MSEEDDRIADAVTLAVAGAAGVLGSAAALVLRARKVRIVPVGESGSGKTTFARYMTGAQIPQEHRRTEVAQEIRGDRLEGMFAPTLVVADVVGGNDGWKDAERRASKAQLVCFFVAWPQIADNSERLIRAAEQVGSWKGRATRVVVVTFRDQARGLTDNAILRDPTVRAVRQRLAASHSFVVDQTDSTSSDALQSQLLALISQRGADSGIR